MPSASFPGNPRIVLIAVALLAAGCSTPPEERAAPEDGSTTTTTSQRGVFPPGRWRPLPGSTDVQREEMERLRSIGYVGGSVREKRSGITVHDRDSAFAGLNFYTSGHAPEAVLMDMDGIVLHRWRLDFEDAWPGSPDRGKRGASWWRRARLLDDGGILAIYEGLGLVRLDLDSRIVWSSREAAHHDLEIVGTNDDIYVLTREPKINPEVHPSQPILEDYLTVLTQDAKEKRRISLVRAFLDSPFREMLKHGRRPAGDILHTNTVHVLDGSIADRFPEFRAGNVLMSMNALGTIAVLDPEAERIIWARWKPPQGRHDPQILDNGNLLIFDNRERAGASAVLEIALDSEEVAWEYRGGPDRPFFSFHCGAVQRLPNGNTLITESDGGRAFEVGRTGTIVWEFYNPHRAGPNAELIATLSKVQRIPAGRVPPRLRGR